MKKPEHKYETMDVPRLDANVKKMNGKSTRHLEECISHLTDVIEETEEGEQAPSCPAEPSKEG
tara:strand:+ start:43596 stop:43784 length:189 start_codon:yes stop_codon:yes gene_type:complete